MEAAKTLAAGVVAALVGASFGCGRPAGDVPPIPTQVVGHCIYVNNFSRAEECREYRGTGWDATAATNDCSGRGSTVVLNQACSYPSIYGRCLLDSSTTRPVLIHFPGDNASRCGGGRTGCEFFGHGYFLPEPICGGDAANNGSTGLPVFQPPTLNCRDPLPGEPAGRSANGQVCTWNAISASTEEGRHFENYASCEQVRTQRPYYPRPPAQPRSTTPDARLQDPAYMAELTWVRGQISSSACVCCHSSAIAPMGPSNWYLEAPGNFMDSFFSSGLALGAGWVSSESFGAYPPEQSNGFSRTTSGFPSTNPARMARFFAAELEHRGLTQADFQGATPFGGPIYEQLIYQPTECTGDSGVAADGTVRWSGGGARYVYVLRAGSRNPGVPPNLDLPDGTLWRVDVPYVGMPVASGLRYGTVPSGMNQRFPATGTAQALTAGSRYYLYVMQDVGIPITRCLFTYPR